MGQPANFIDRNHPSFGAQSMWFLFATQVKGAVQRLLLVEAKDPWAIQCMERMLGDDNRVSPTCHCILVFRDCKIGLRNDLAEAVEFQEFVTTMVEPSRILDSTSTIHALQKAIEPKAAPVRALPPPRRTVQTEKATPVAMATKRAPEAPATAPAKDEGAVTRSKLAGILRDLGIEASRYEPLIKSLDVHSKSDINELVHQCLQALDS